MKVVVVHILTQGLVTIPALLVECLRGHMEKWYGLEQDDRIFPYTKSIVNHVMTRACDAVGVKDSHAARRFSHQRLMVTKKPSNVAILQPLQNANPEKCWIVSTFRDLIA